MRFIETTIPGAWLIEIDRIEDGRGFLARAWCRREFAEHGLQADFVQCNISFNRLRGTLRGLHYQAPPHEETKLVRCTRGALFDVLVDWRPGSFAYRRWEGFELTADNHRMLYVPEGIAHGFQTLEDDTEVFYQMGEFHHPESAHGLRWDDPALGIRWPLGKPIVSDRDSAYPGIEA